MKHLFATLVGLTIIIVAAFSIKFLIYGFPKSIENSSFNPAPLSDPLTTNVDCDEPLKVVNDLKISGNNITSLNLNFKFSPYSNWKFSEQQVDPSILSATFTDDENHRFLVVTASQMNDECFDKQKKDTDSAYSSGEAKKELASWHKENKAMQLVDAGELQSISDETYKKNGANYYESAGYFYVGKAKKVLYLTSTLILKSPRYFYDIKLASDSPIPQSIVREAVGYLTFN